MNQPSSPAASLPATRRGKRVFRSPRADGAPLGGLSVDEFLRDHWQRKPLLVRAALPDLQPPCDAAALIELAGQDDVQSRLVTAFRGRWQLDHGPFEAGGVPPLSHRRWTLLVQGVNLHLDAAEALLSRFRFIPDARLDDLMISLASDQGGVGPHVDSYDVFLVQLWGRRRWRIAPPGNDQLRTGLPLKILERFNPTDDWVLEPGDMLYLPPGWAHDGTALGPCMTGSIGFRAPSRHEFLREFLTDAAESIQGRDPRFADPGRCSSTRPRRPYRNDFLQGASATGCGSIAERAYCIDARAPISMASRCRRYATALHSRCCERSPTADRWMATRQPVPSHTPCSHNI